MSGELEKRTAEWPLTMDEWLATLRDEVARLTAENEHLLNGNALMLSRNIDLGKQLESLNRHHQKREAQYEQWLAERTQQLAAVEKLPSSFCLCQKCRCTWDWTITKSSRCPVCRHVEEYKPDGMGE